MSVVGVVTVKVKGETYSYTLEEWLKLTKWFGDQEIASIKYHKVNITDKIDERYMGGRPERVNE